MSQTSQTARPTDESAVVVSYHEKSELALPHTAEMELAEIFEHLSHTAQVQTRLLHVLGEWAPTYGSWFPPQFSLIVCVTGPVPGKLPLAGIAAELERFFNRQIARRTTFDVHFVLLLDLWIGRQPLRLALTFNDKTTLKIAMWRFVKYLHGDPRTGAVLGEEGYVTLAYPASAFGVAGVILLLCPSSSWASLGGL